MGKFSEKYYGKKIVVLNAEKTTKVRFKHSINKKQFKWNLLFVGLGVLIVVNIINVAALALGVAN